MQPIDFFLHAAMRYPDRIAAIDAASGFAHTYEALRGQALALAAALQRLSGKPRPVIATLAGNSHAMLLGILATYACGGVLVPLTPTVVEQDIARQLATAAPDIVLHDAAYEALLVSYQGLRICNDESREFQTDALAREYAGQSPSRGNRIRAKRPPSSSRADRRACPRRYCSRCAVSTPWWRPWPWPMASTARNASCWRRR